MKHADLTKMLCVCVCVCGVVGSFRQSVQEDWFAGIYADQSNGDAQPAFAAQTPPTTTLGDNPQFVCEHCNKNFSSQNQLWRHARVTGHSAQRPQPAPQPTMMTSPSQKHPINWQQTPQLASHHAFGPATSSSSSFSSFSSHMPSLSFTVANSHAPGKASTLADELCSVLLATEDELAKVLLVLRGLFRAGHIDENQMAVLKELALSSSSSSTTTTTSIYQPSICVWEETKAKRSRSDTGILSAAVSVFQLERDTDDLIHTLSRVVIHQQQQ